MEQLDTSFLEEDPFTVSGFGLEMELPTTDMPANAGLQSKERNLGGLQLKDLASPLPARQHQDPTASALPAANLAVPVQGEQGSISFNNQSPYPQVQQAAALQNSGYQQPQQPLHGQQIRPGPMQQGFMQQELIQQGNVQAMQNAVATLTGEGFSSNLANDMFPGLPMGHYVGNGAALTTAIPSQAQQGFAGGSTPMTMAMYSGDLSTSPGLGIGNTCSNNTLNQPVPQAFQGSPGTNDNGRKIPRPIKKSPFELLQTFPARNTSEKAMPHTLIESFESSRGGVPSNFSENTVKNLFHGSFEFYHSGPPPICHTPTNNPVATMLNNAVAIAESTRKNATDSVIQGILNDILRFGTIGGQHVTHLLSSNRWLQTALCRQITDRLSATHSTDATEDIYSAYAATSAFYGSHPEILEKMLEKCQNLSEEEKSSTIGLINGNPVLALMEQRQTHLLEAYMANFPQLNNSQMNAGQLGAPLPNQSIQPQQTMMAPQGSQLMPQFRPGQPSQQQPRQLAPATAHAPFMGMTNGVPAGEVYTPLWQRMGLQGPAREPTKPNKRKRGHGQSGEAKGTRQARPRKKRAQEAASGEAPTTGKTDPAEEPNATWDQVWESKSASSLCGSSGKLDSFLLTGETMTRHYHGLPSPVISYECDDGQHRILSDERLQAARERTDGHFCPDLMALAAENAQSQMTVDVPVGASLTV